VQNVKKLSASAMSPATMSNWRLALLRLAQKATLYVCPMVNVCCGIPTSSRSSLNETAPLPKTLFDVLMNVFPTVPSTGFLLRNGHGAIGEVFEIKYYYRHYMRIELSGQWYVASDPKEIIVHARLIKVDEQILDQDVNMTMINWISCGRLILRGMNSPPLKRESLKVPKARTDIEMRTVFLIIVSLALGIPPGQSHVKCR
jgi:hypothetical protein